MDLYSPIEADFNGVEGKKRFANSRMIADGDNARLDNTDILIVCIDGDIIPSGSSAEIGVMREKIRRGDHKYIIGITTDNRNCFVTHSAEKDIGGAAEQGEMQYAYQNLYVTGCIKQSGWLVGSIEEAIEKIKLIENEFEGEDNVTK